MKSLMNRYVKLLSFLPGICLIVACTGHQIKGYEINGSAPLPEFEGKMVYMKDVSSGQPVDSAEIIHGKFDFSDTEIGVPSYSAESVPGLEPSVVK